MQLVIERQPRERLNALITMAIMGSGASILLTISLLRSYSQGRQVRLLEKRNQHARWQTSRDLEKRRNNDELTGLLSGAGLSKAMDIQTRRFPGFRQAIAHIDLDHFSLINNGLGKGQGDAVLQKFTRHLQAAMHPSAVIGRIGSDNFACCLISTSDSALRTEVSSLSQKLNDLIININNQPLNITVSIGAALVEECQHSQALHEAGIACSAVKVAGGHGYQFFGDAKGTTSGYLSIQQANQELVSAIHEERLELYGQHAWQLNGDPSLPATYVELLCRIKHPTSGAAYWREDIIEAAQLCGSLPLFDQTIIALACSSLKRLMQRSNVSAASTEPIYAINITPDTLITPHFAQKLDQLADSHGIDPQMICLEITEQAALRHPGEAIGAMRKLRQLGFRLALDDFGTGMTSLGYLRDLPLNYVKIDKSFIRKSAHDKPGNLIVQFVVELSKEIGFQTIAEGVEDLEQLLKLKAAGISIAQGYITTRPCPFLPSGDSWALTRSGAETLGEENLRSSSLSNPDQGTSQAQP
jgi:diguanylate cyclase (GGDEF)-like protein